jgi:hypothetical protein
MPKFIENHQKPTNTARKKAQDKVYTPSYFSVVKKRINSTFSADKLITQQDASGSSS